MNIRLTPKSMSFYLLLTALFALGLFFSMRFLPKGTATESENTIVSHTPATKSSQAENQQTETESKPQDPPEIPPDKAIQQLAQVWNQGSAEEIANLFMTDGTLIIPTGSQIQSRAEIQKTISEKRAGILKETTLTNTVDEITRPDPNTVLVEGTYKLDGIKVLGVSTSATGLYKIRQVKRDGRWFISRAEVIRRDKG
jgi:uncharacterized protein (TIGR02246 family)